MASTSGSDGASRSLPGGVVTFTPLAFDGLGWSRIGGPQLEARAACLLATAHIHLFRPQLPLRELDVLAEEVIQELEAGAVSVAVVDQRHRVDRAELSRTASSAVTSVDQASGRAPCGE